MGIATDFLELTRSHNQLLRIEEAVEVAIKENKFLDIEELTKSLHTYIKLLHDFYNSIITYQASALSAQREIVTYMRYMKEIRGLDKKIEGDLIGLSDKLQNKASEIKSRTLILYDDPYKALKPISPEDMDKLAIAIVRLNAQAHKLGEDIKHSTRHGLLTAIKNPLKSAKQIAQARDLKGPLNNEIRQLIGDYYWQVDNIFFFELETDQLLAGLLKDIEDTLRVIQEISGYNLFKSNSYPLTDKKSSLESIRNSIKKLYGRELTFEDRLGSQLEALRPKLAELEKKAYLLRNYRSEMLQEPDPGVILLHTLIDRDGNDYNGDGKYDVWIEILRKIIASNKFMSGDIRNNPAEDRGISAFGSGEVGTRYIQASYFSLSRDSVFGANFISFFFTYEDLVKSNARVFLYAKESYFWAIVNIYDASTGWFGGARIPFTNTHLAIKLSDANIGYILKVMSLIHQLPSDWVREHVLFYSEKRYNNSDVLRDLLHDYIRGNKDLYSTSRSFLLKLIERELQWGYEVMKPLIQICTEIGYITEAEKEELLGRISKPK